MFNIEHWLLPLPTVYRVLLPSIPITLILLFVCVCVCVHFRRSFGVASLANRYRSEWKLKIGYRGRGEGRGAVIVTARSWSASPEVISGISRAILETAATLSALAFQILEFNFAAESTLRPTRLSVNVAFFRRLFHLLAGHDHALLPRALRRA